MQFQTYSQLITKLQNDLDISDGVFITPTELLGYINEGIADAETLVHQLHHEGKYFLTKVPLTWQTGVAGYALPADIYGTKIRLLFYNNGSDKYEITRSRDLLSLPFVVAGDRYRYNLENSSLPTGMQMVFYPTVAETSTNATLWYIRHARQLTSDTTDVNNVLEIPEAGNFIYQHVRRSVAKKSKRADWIATEEAGLQVQYGLLGDVLKEMTVDQNTLVPMDLTSYYNQEISTY